MKLFEANISPQAIEAFNTMLGGIAHFGDANEKILEAFGLKDFFESQQEYEFFKEAIFSIGNNMLVPDRGEYGDFQTNRDLANSVIDFLKKKELNPKLIIEPTCGKGNFLLAALTSFSGIKKMVGVEIYKPYVWETKFTIVDFFISNPAIKKPEIEIHHCNVFDFNFSAIANDYLQSEVLVIGNPPWVTNAKLGVWESDNLPPKSNFKKNTGLDAITGKGNFDIAEYITMMMLEAFQNISGTLALLVKNSVIKNVVFDQKQRNYKISNLQKLTIDSKKEFNASVEASLLFCKLNSGTEYTCKEFNFYSHSECIREFGWLSDKFVSNTIAYHKSQDIDGVSPFEWRQGVKHDLSSIMEMERVNDYFVNGLQQEVLLEEDLVYGLLKSSDLKQAVINQPRKFTIITQTKVGQDTSYIEQSYPDTFRYLQDNKPKFEQRKSSIYNNKPDFSIFGIGDYSFAPYKVAISGLYKTCSFSLILPFQNKPLMLDDTCYLLGFDDLNYAVYTHILLNSDKTKELLQSITFSDAKRTFTKEVLMRIDLFKLAVSFSENALQKEIVTLNNDYGLSATMDRWDDYFQILSLKQSIGKQVLLHK